MNGQFMHVKKKYHGWKRHLEHKEKPFQFISPIRVIKWRHLLEGKKVQGKDPKRNSKIKNHRNIRLLEEVPLLLKKSKIGIRNHYDK